MKILIVEDTLERIKIFKEILNGELVFTDSASAAIELLSSVSFDAVFLDYDLGEGRDSGYSVATWIEAHPQKDLRIIIHSMNPVGAKKISDALPAAERIPFPNLFPKDFSTGSDVYTNTDSDIKIVAVW